MPRKSYKPEEKKDKQDGDLGWRSHHHFRRPKQWRAILPILDRWAKLIPQVNG